MFDIKAIRDNPDIFDAGCARRGLQAQTPAILRLDEAHRNVQTRLQDVQATRNAQSRKIGEIKKSGGDASAQMDAVAALKTEMATLEEREKTLGDDLHTLLAGLPNIIADDVPDGADEADNVELRRVGEVTKPKGLDHVEIGEKLGLIDFETAAKMSGARFVVLKGGIARLERALAQFMLDIHTTEHGYTEVSPPLLVRDAALFGTGQLPKFEDDQFVTTRGDWLVPTAEVPLTNLVREDILDLDTLPHRYTAFTPCFRQEAGSAGKDTRGMLRQHQFYKVEMVSITTPENSAAEHDRMTRCAETILEKLKLPYRTVVLCSGDTGFGARKTHDIEVWLPGQETYREISSCSNCGDFQARRMNTRFRDNQGDGGRKHTQFVHTLNGSGVAVGRALIAVIENYFDADKGVIVIPDVLKPYMGGLDVVG